MGVMGGDADDDGGPEQKVGDEEDHREGREVLHIPEGRKIIIEKGII